jgi:hypothetical protein
MADVCKEAKAIREALSPLGWQYTGGGPYPSAPVLSFINDTDKKLIVLVSTTTKGGE